MYHKHVFTGLLMLLGVASGATGCVGVDGEDFSEQWGDEDELTAQSAPEPGSDDVVARRPYPNCGILACPAATTCQYDKTGEARCAAPTGTTCSTLDCGAYHYCQMMPTGAICVSGASDM